MVCTPWVHWSAFFFSVTSAGVVLHAVAGRGVCSLVAGTECGVVIMRCRNGTRGAA